MLSIAGSDSSCGAGIQSDIKTITSLGAHPLTAVTAVTAQNSLGIVSIHRIPARFVSLQIESVLEDVFPHAVKIGMLGTGSVVRATAKVLGKYGLQRIVLDPVLRATAGGTLLEPEALSLLRERLLPLAAVVTPNLEEAGILTGGTVRNLKDMEAAARAIRTLGPDVVVTGGHLRGDPVDLVYDGKITRLVAGPRIETPHTHGSGCVFSSALATFLAMGHGVGEAARHAQAFTRAAIERGYACGRGAGAVRPSGLHGTGPNEANLQNE
ncbi:MAG: bifunctional hydroxymethylpyrimidine kinase/phosphomethylpyrimidine kinase [Deltaproteobacteria bacterium]|nr:bifunctional hydroxymethylpyrimidine kinase/phosphomethylpyrimidine kinase [Deltaproteobacteria bacterium]